MISARYFSASGEPGETFQLPEDPFDGVVNEAVLHQAILAYLANQRQGNHSTKTRGEVRGGGRKPWRQKGTGRARQGSIRAPHWRGGGIAFGPRPRSYRQDLPKKMRTLARRSAFNTRALADQVSVIERLDIDAPKTKDMLALLGKVGIADSKVLILTADTSEAVYLSARNLPRVHVREFRNASAYEVLHANHLLITEDALAGASAEAALVEV